MESSSHITGDDGEGCNSSESGWTMYLASPMHGDDDGGKRSGSEGGSSVDDGYGYIDGRGARNGKACELYADDDSLASDASTGPAKVKAPSSSSSLPERGKDDDDDDEGRGKDGDRGGADDDEEEDEDGGRAKSFSTGSSRKKSAGKVDKGGESKSSTSRRGHGKRGASSRRSFFFW